MDKSSGETHSHTWAADKMRAVYGITPEARIADVTTPMSEAGYVALTDADKIKLPVA